MVRLVKNARKRTVMFPRTEHKQRRNKGRVPGFAAVETDKQKTVDTKAQWFK
jgi:hypothetical protein